MARDLDLQYDGLMPAGGHLFDIGAVDFSSGSSTAEAATVLLSVKAGMAIAQTKAAGNQTLIATTDGDVSNGNLTFRREGAYISEDARYYYFVIGS